MSDDAQSTVITYKDYRPAQTRAHNSEDLPVINAMREYLADESHGVEQLLRCVASAAVDAQVGGHERDCALGWPNWTTNEIADGRSFQ